MDIDSPVLRAFCDETARTTSDRLYVLLYLPDQILQSAIGKGLPAILGTTAEKLLQPTPWEQADYDAIPVQNITGTDSGNRTLLTNHAIIKFLRIMVTLRGLVLLHPEIASEVGLIAINPRAY